MTETTAGTADTRHLSTIDGTRRIYAHELRAGMMLRRTFASPNFDRVVGTSRAVPASADRVCIFVAGIDAVRGSFRSRRYFEINETVEIVK